jgi:hypothetical protein
MSKYRVVPYKKYTETDYKVMAEHFWLQKKNRKKFPILFNRYLRNKGDKKWFDGSLFLD